MPFRLFYLQVETHPFSQLFSAVHVSKRVCIFFSFALSHAALVILESKLVQASIICN